MTRWPAIVLVVLLLGGCSLDGRGTLPLARGAGPDAVRVTVEMADIGNLVPNAEVKVNDVTVGTVTGIAMRNWRANLTVEMQRSARLPANAVANVGQKSLLGAQYLQLAAPADARPVGTLQSGAVIPLERTGAYPSTEDLLIALSTFLNGSGLTQLRTITVEVNRALSGREDDIRALLGHLRTLSQTLSGQQDTMVELLDRLNGLTGDLADVSPKIDRSLPALAPGLAALSEQRPAVVRALTAVRQLDAAARPVLDANRAGLVQEIRDLRPVLSRVADAGNDVADSLDYLGTVIYPLRHVPDYFRGDYLNVFLDLDLRGRTVQKTILSPGDLAPDTTVRSFGQLLAGGVR